MLRLRLVAIALSCIAAAFAVTAARAEPSAGADLDAAAHRAIAGNVRERFEAIAWLLENGDLGSVAVLIQLLRWLPDDEDAIVARLRHLTGADPGARWFDWMLWQQAHPEIMPYPGYAGFLSDLLVARGVISQRRRSGLRRRYQRRCARLSAPHRQLARDGERCGGRRAREPRLLHALRRRHSLRWPRPGGAIIPSPSALPGFSIARTS